MLPLGPLMDVVGVVSSVPDDVVVLDARVVSPLAPVAAVDACAVPGGQRLVAMVAEAGHVRVAPVPPSVALRLLAAPKVVVKAVPLSWRYWPLSRSWTWTCTRPTVPEATRAVPVMSNGVLLTTTLPSIGVAIVVS